MGNLTDDMTRLRNEIVALRGARGTLMQNLTHGATGLAAGVTRMLGEFHQSNARMARKTHADCAQFLAGVERTVNGLKKTVAGLQAKFAADLRGGREAWRGGRAARRTRGARRGKRS